MPYTTERSVTTTNYCIHYTIMKDNSYILSGMGSFPKNSPTHKPPTLIKNTRNFNGFLCKQELIDIPDYYNYVHTISGSRMLML